MSVLLEMKVKPEVAFENTEVQGLRRLNKRAGDVRPGCRSAYRELAGGS